MDLQLLIKAGLHFGHRKSRWSPKMDRYIWGFQGKVHLIDVSKTAYQLEKASKFLTGVAADGKTILWVGTKKPAQNIIFSVADRLKMPYVNHRWIGGTLSNYGQVKKSVTKLLHYEDIIARAASFSYYTKKELNTFKKMVDRLKKNVGGIVNLKWPIGAIVLVDVRKEMSTLREARTMGIPVVALVDTNSDPSMVDYVIPGNDDSPRAIKVVIDYLADAVEHGKEQVAKKVKEVKPEEKEEIKEIDIVAIVAESDTEEEDSGKLRKADDVKIKKVVKKVAREEVKDLKSDRSRPIKKRVISSSNNKSKSAKKTKR